MMKKDSFKKLGIFGVSFALMASPLAFADMHEEGEPDTGTRQETDLNLDQGTVSPEPEEEGVTVGLEDDPADGTRQQTNLEDDEGTVTTVEGDDDDTGIPGTGAESEPPTGTQGQPALDDE
ncbi:hypothetical protein [Halovibrio sp. HP20-50]|uniref:hypothetical protein n=1 Tax=Halovibrio sp. HP20-59 TaxID=3080275 RepID=UPI00294B1A1F|nr:hypothetical protein [Halovibrio sp. HP20-59]MEA2119667.1 hypothetical protein [Halovibrio sp. HP20-59]